MVTYQSHGHVFLQDRYVSLPLSLQFPFSYGVLKHWVIFGCSKLWRWYACSWVGNCGFLFSGSMASTVFSGFFCHDPLNVFFL